jgi:membrane protein
MLSSFLDTTSYYTKGLYKRFWEDDIFVWASAIAFKVMVAFLPLVALALGTLGWILQAYVVGQNHSAFEAIGHFIQSFIPNYENDLVIHGIESLAQVGSTFTLFGGISLLILAISLFSTLQTVVEHIFHEERGQRVLWKAYLFDLQLVFQTGIFFLASVVLTVILTAVKTTGAEYLASFPNAPLWMLTVWDMFSNGIASYLLPLLITAAMFFQLYYFIPLPHPPLRSVLVGTLFTSLLWEVAKNLFTWYATTLKPFERFDDSQGGLVPSLGDFFGVTMALVFWAYYSGLVFVIGGMIAALHETRQRNRQSKPRVVDKIGI